jgi:DNA-binding response OmpR family regulator
MKQPARIAAADSRHILVIEDTGSVADLMREVLSALGHHIEVCATVEEGLAKFAPMKYDLVITDYTMPGINGIELSHIIRRQAPEQIILLVTGSTFRMGDDASREHPINAVLQKPFAIAEFQNVVVKLLSNTKQPIHIDPAKKDSRDLRK